MSQPPLDPPLRSNELVQDIAFLERRRFGFRCDNAPLSHWNDHSSSRISMTNNSNYSNHDKDRSSLLQL
jgi:hypothetical protein